ncbi:MAG: hypothetical protein K0S09_110 [Sphingobacteriaceae bacterium]|nr:hypothetical protein [Sphingobacteriaceae bacterium]
MRLYPPLLFQRIWVKDIGKGFRSVEVKISKSIVNLNYNRSIFGGTIFTASDPFYSLIFDQILRRKGYKVRVWLKSASINYLKPGRTNLHFTVSLRDEDIAEACEALDTVGKFVKAYRMEMYDEHGLHCVTVSNEVYIRNLHTGENNPVAY